jgi:hypothetical protein
MANPGSKEITSQSLGSNSLHQLIFQHYAEFENRDDITVDLLYELWSCLSS